MAENVHSNYRHSVIRSAVEVSVNLARIRPCQSLGQCWQHRTCVKGLRSVARRRLRVKVNGSCFVAIFCRDPDESLKRACWRTCGRPTRRPEVNSSSHAPREEASSRGTCGLWVAFFIPVAEAHKLAGWFRGVNDFWWLVAGSPRTVFHKWPTTYAVIQGNFREMLGITSSGPAAV